MKISESKLRGLIGESIKEVLKEKYLYHVSGWGDGKEINTERPEPYYSENRWSKWEGSGHETGSFGSGMYFTDETPYDNKLSDGNRDIARSAKYDERFNDKKFVKIGERLYRVDTDFFKNLYILKSEQEGDILKRLMTSVDSFVRHFQYSDNNYSDMRYRQNRWLIINKDIETLGLRMPWSYKGFCKFAINYCKDSSIKQTPATIFMEMNGFNGVDATMAGKYNSYWEGSVIYDLNKIEKDIEPILNKRDEFKIAYGEKFNNNMYSDILKNKALPSFYRKDFEPFDKPDEILKALKRYNMVLSHERFWSLPDDIKRKYLIILYRNIKKGFIRLDDNDKWFSTDGLKELRNDVYIDEIIKNGLTEYMNLNDKITQSIMWEFSYGRIDRYIVLKFLEAYEGDLEKFEDYEEIKKEYSIK